MEKTCRLLFTLILSLLQNKKQKVQTYLMGYKSCSVLNPLLILFFVCIGQSGVGTRQNTLRSNVRLSLGDREMWNSDYNQGCVCIVNERLCINYMSLCTETWLFCVSVLLWLSRADASFSVYVLKSVPSVHVCKQGLLKRTSSPSFLPFWCITLPKAQQDDLGCGRPTT